MLHLIDKLSQRCISFREQKLASSDAEKLRISASVSLYGASLSYLMPDIRLTQPTTSPVHKVMEQTGSDLGFHYPSFTGPPQSADHRDTTHIKQQTQGL